MSKENLQDIQKQLGLKVYTRANAKAFRHKYIYIDLREIRFANDIGDWMGVQNGTEVTFLNLGDDWYMTFNSGDQGAYKVNRETKHRSGCRISSSYMVRALLSTLCPGKNKVRCTLEISPRFEYKNKSVYKICKP